MTSGGNFLFQESVLHAFCTFPLPSRTHLNSLVSTCGQFEKFSLAWILVEELINFFSRCLLGTTALEDSYTSMEAYVWENLTNKHICNIQNYSSPPMMNVYPWK